MYMVVLVPDTVIRQLHTRIVCTFMGAFRVWGNRKTCGNGVSPVKPGASSNFSKSVVNVLLFFILNVFKTIWNIYECIIWCKCINYFILRSSGPSKLVGHTAVLFKESMLVYGGGETQSSPQNSLWSFNLTTMTWKKLPLLTGSTSPCRIHHCSVGLGPGFQPTAPHSGHSRETPNSHNKRRPFKNKCLPTLQETGIELQTLKKEYRKCLPDFSTALKEAKLKSSCLTFENQEAVSEKWNDHHLVEETDDAVLLHMPDLLLVLGGKPLQGQHGISVWHMTMAWMGKNGILVIYSVCYFLCEKWGFSNNTHISW